MLFSMVFYVGELYESLCSLQGLFSFVIVTELSILTSVMNFETILNKDNIYLPPEFFSYFLRQPVAPHPLPRLDEMITFALSSYFISLKGFLQLLQVYCSFWMEICLQILELEKTVYEKCKQLSESIK